MPPSNHVSTYRRGRDRSSCFARYTLERQRAFFAPTTQLRQTLSSPPFSPFLTNLSIEKFDREILSLSLSLYMRKVPVKISSNREKKTLRLVGNAVVNATTLEEQLQRDVEIIDREILRRKNRPKFLSCRFIVRNG